MRLTKTELSVLKKMSQLNESGSFYKGKEIWSNTPNRGIIMCMTIEDTIDYEFHVLRLQKLLTAYQSLNDNAEILTSDTNKNFFVTDKINSYKIKKIHKDHTNIITSSKDLTSHDIEFSITKDDINVMKSAMSIIEDSDHIKFENTGISVLSNKSHITDKFNIKRELSPDEFSVHIESKNFNFISHDDYTVTVKKRTSNTPFVIKMQSDTSPYYYLFVETTF